MRERIEFRLRKQVSELVNFYQLSISVVQDQDCAVTTVVPVIERDQLAAVGHKNVHGRDRVQQLDRPL